VHIGDLDAEDDADEEADIADDEADDADDAEDIADEGGGEVLLLETPNSKADTSSLARKVGL